MGSQRIVLVSGSYALGAIVGRQYPGDTAIANAVETNLSVKSTSLSRSMVRSYQHALERCGYLGWREVESIQSWRGSFDAEAKFALCGQFLRDGLEYRFDRQTGGFETRRVALTRTTTRSPVSLAITDRC